MTTIGRSLTISGELAGDEDLVLEGQVTGYVTVRDAALTVGEHASVKADIRGVRVLVRGRVEGSIVASQRIELAPGCDVTGSLSANQVVIVDGARFTGRVDMDQRTIAARLAQYKADHAVTA